MQVLSWWHFQSVQRHFQCFSSQISMNFRKRRRRSSKNNSLRNNVKRMRVRNYREIQSLVSFVVSSYNSREFLQVLIFVRQKILEENKLGEFLPFFIWINKYKELLDSTAAFLTTHVQGNPNRKSKTITKVTSTVSFDHQSILSTSFLPLSYNIPPPIKIPVILTSKFLSVPFFTSLIKL